MDIIDKISIGFRIICLQLCLNDRGFPLIVFLRILLDHKLTKQYITEIEKS